MKYVANNGNKRGRLSRERGSVFGSVFSGQTSVPGAEGGAKDVYGELTVPKPSSPSRVFRLREVLVGWFYRWVGGSPKPKLGLEWADAGKVSLDGAFPRNSGMNGRRSSVSRCSRGSRASTRSKSGSLDRNAVPSSRRLRRSAIDLTAGSRSSGVAAVSSLRSADGILSSYTFFVTAHRGAHAKIIKARCKRTGERVVLKVFDKTRLPNTSLESITKEIRILTVTKGVEGVVQLLGSYEDAHQAIAVQEECSGGTLISLMVSRGGRLPERSCVKQVVRPLLQALALLHARGIVLRDLKPEHIMFDGNGKLRLIDFFSAAVLGEDSLVGKEGTLAYMAPEVVQKPSPDDVFSAIVQEGLSESDLPAYDEKVDIWSMGVCVFEALTGRQPFLAESSEEMLTVHAAALGREGGVRASFDNVKMREFMSQDALDFLGLAMRLAPEERPSARQLLEHPWVRQSTRASLPLCSSRNRSRDDTPTPSDDAFFEYPSHRW